MDRININGEDWVRLHDICDIMREVETYPAFENTDKVIEQIAQLMFHDEVEKAGNDPEARKAARELPGDFIVCKKLGYTNPNGKKVIYFMEFSEGEGKAVDDISKAMYFEYKSMADKVAKTLGEGWRSVCMGVESGRIAHRVMERINKMLDEADDEDETTEDNEEGQEE